MRRGMVALTLLFGLGVGGVLSAEESGNWFTRLFTRSSIEKETKKAKDGSPTLTPVLPNIALIRAQASLQRRQAACLRLREIAIETNDEALLQKAEELDERAFKAYTNTRQRSGETQQPVGEYNLKDAKTGARRAKGGL